MLLLPWRLRPLVALLLVSAVAAPSSASHCVLLYQEDFETSILWTTSNTGSNKWSYVDEAGVPPPLGYNAHSGTRYWYVGAPRAPDLTYFGGDDGTLATPSTLTSPPIALPVATGLELRAHVSGESEWTFDFLRVYVDDGNPPTLVQTLTGQRSYGPPVSVSLDAFAGSTVHVILEFSTDPIVERGPGWKVDDVSVRDC